MSEKTKNSCLVVLSVTIVVLMVIFGFVESIAALAIAMLGVGILACIAIVIIGISVERDRDMFYNKSKMNSPSAICSIGGLIALFFASMLFFLLYCFSSQGYNNWQIFGLSGYGLILMIILGGIIYFWEDVG